jgi:hypothetical protein
MAGGYLVKHTHLKGVNFMSGGYLAKHSNQLTGAL